MYKTRNHFRAKAARSIGKICPPHTMRISAKKGSFAILLAQNMQIDLFRPLAGSVFCSERLHQSKIHDFAAVPQPFSLKINFQ